MANSGSPRKSGSGNRRPPGTGNRSSTTRRSGAPSTAQGPATSSRAATQIADAEKLSADERARDRLSRSTAGTKRPASGGGSRPAGRADPRKRGRQRRSTSATAGIFGGAFVVLAVAVIILISTLGSSSAFGSPILFTPASSSIVNAVTHVPTYELNEAGVGGNQVTVKGVFAATPKQPAITDGTKPVLVYVGAEYCPYCAASRWPLIIALSRFGTFTGLGTIGSSPYDVYANTRTFSFAKATYTSNYLVFDPTEYLSNQCTKIVSSGCDSYKTLQVLTSKNAKLFETYDSPTYFPSATTGGGIPFIDWGGKYVSSGAVYIPSAINNGNSTNWQGWHPLSWDQIINTFKIPTSGPGQAILGAANVYTAAICEMTHNQPSSVCSLPVIKQAEAELPSS